jgi:hypothetical protein
LCRRLLIEVTLIAYYIKIEILIAEKLTFTPYFDATLYIISL